MKYSRENNLSKMLKVIPRVSEARQRVCYGGTSVPSVAHALPLQVHFREMGLALLYKSETRGTY